MEDEIRLLQAHIKDLDRQAYDRDITKNTGFLSLSEQAVFHETEPELLGKHFLEGGHADCDRAMVVWPASYDSTSGRDLISLICVSPLNPKFSEKLTHRDYLGALMSLGIRRDRIGDILTDGAVGYIFCCSDIAGFICEELSVVRNTSVSLKQMSWEHAEIRQEFLELRVNAPSVRLDAVIAAVYRLSRTQSAGLVEAGNVYVDGRMTDSCGMKLKEGTRVSVRGKGKFIYDGEDGATKKGRVYLKIRCYA